MSTPNTVPNDIVGLVMALSLWVGVLSIWFHPLESVIAFWAVIASPFIGLSMLYVLVAWLVLFLVKTVFSLVFWLSIILVIGICFIIAFGDLNLAKQELQRTTTDELEGEVERGNREVRIESKTGTETESNCSRCHRQELHHKRRWRNATINFAHNASSDLGSFV
jgi:ABC-type multidrug transport system fused ATPase/permease subunit